MKRRLMKLMSLLATATFVLTAFSVPVFAEGTVDGNTAFDEWSGSVLETDLIDEQTQEPIDQQAAFEAAVEMMEEIESARINNTYIAEGPPLDEILESGNYQEHSAEQLWEALVLEEASAMGLQGESIGGSYELKTFTDEAFAGEERFAIYRVNNVVTGWEEDSGNPGKWWYKENGVKVSGWKYISGLWYYFDPNTTNHYMVHGWLLDGEAYYFMGTPGQPESGAMYTGGWLNDTEAGGTTSSPIWYYMNTDGKMHHGWLTYQGNRYYMGYPDAPMSGVMYNRGWMIDSGNTYYFGTDGVMKTDFVTISGDGYYFGASGILKKGWFMIGGDTYHGNRYNGALDTGTVEMSEYVTSTFWSDYKWQNDMMNSLGTVTINGQTSTIMNTRWANTHVRDDGKRGPTLSMAGTNGFNNEFSNGNTDLIEDAADYYNNNTDGLVAINTGSQFTPENAAVVVGNGPVGTSLTAARTFIQSKDGLWFDGKSYNLEIQQQLTYDESFDVGETIKGIIVFNSGHYNDLTDLQIKTVLRHEIGHVVGLRHTYEPQYSEPDPGISALMHPYYDSPDASLTFTTYDLNELGMIYPY